MKKRIIELYKSGKNLSEIAKIVGVHKSSVWRACRKAGIMRTMSEASKGKILSESHKRKIGKGVKTSEKHKKYMMDKRKKLKYGYDKPTKELAYISGVMLTDGYVYNGGIGLESIDKEFVDLFSELCEKQFGIKANRYINPPRKMIDPRIGKEYQTKKRFMVRLCSKNLEKFCRNINVDFARNLPEDLKIYVLKGMWDGDGSYAKEAEQILFYNKDRGIIEFFKELLINTMNFKKISEYLQPNEVIKIYFGRQAQIKKFFETVKPTITRKYKQ